MTQKDGSIMPLSVISILNEIHSMQILRRFFIYPFLKVTSYLLDDLSLLDVLSVPVADVELVAIKAPNGLLNLLA